ncbi:LysR family transcriptional regulator (plasmid) [Paracoccus yeei]|uniref:LysR family transcriptional regulator n=1 Tax=Paracoccus yeei TaxID=147645 RepID=A0A1V0GXV6_9RHOB|nr:LysR family transcriptional regulator [Paracoccus yeei]ARC38714.1 LysR family transcriptional regulator [Paracoccus yeei]QEU08584.1 LysR family transcriptional regulator [Paracoccus yeei]
MDLKQLRTFIMVAESGSLSSASDRLRLAQPALSRQIKLLEDEIGFDLFIRSGRGMQLTEHGGVLLSRVAGLIKQLDDSIQDVRSLLAEPTGHVVLGCIPTASHVVAGRIAVRVAAELPQVSLRIVEGYAGHLIDWLHRGEVDLAVLYGPSSDLHLRISDIMFEELVLVSPAGKAPEGDEVPVAALGDLNLVLPSRPHGLRLLVEAAAAKAATTINVKFQADSFRVLKDIVAAGLGHTILPLSAFYREPQMELYQITRLVSPRISRRLVMALPPNRQDTKATAAVRDLVTDEILRMVKSGEWRTMPR